MLLLVQKMKEIVNWKQEYGMTLTIDSFSHKTFSSERERVAKEYEESVTAEPIPKLRLPFPSATAGDSDEEFISCRDQFVKPEIINPSGDDNCDEDSDLELEEVNLKFKTSPRSMSNPKEKNVQIKVPRKQKIPFCAARSTQPSHNVGLNIQGISDILFFIQ